ncbi:MAG TPA: serine/threonine-protein kinase [Myxococcaceae bacterium]
MPTQDVSPELLPAGSRVGPWRVVRCAGQGMFGTVYCVERVEPEDPRLFALKLASYPRDPRFEREVELLGRIHHGQVPRLHDRGWWKHSSEVLFPYFVMDWVEGKRLYDWAAERRVSSREVLRLLSQVSRALEATHAVGGLHRDVKGTNVLVRVKDSAAVLVDFGAGTFRGAPPLTWQALPPGTPQYRSPEALRCYVKWRPHRDPSYEAGPADDLYALGVMAYRLVTGTYPPPHVQVEVAPPEGFESDNVPKWVPPEVLTTVSPELATLIRQLLAVEPSARGSAGQVAEAMESAVRTAGRESDRPITARKTPDSRVSRRWGAALRSVLERASWRTAAAVGMALVVGAMWGVHVAGEEYPGQSESARVAPKEWSTVGLADSEEIAQARATKSVSKQEGIGREMPKGPFPGQHLAPCKLRYEEEIRGGCWVPLRMKPPCGREAYEWNGTCYLASFPAEREPNAVKQ